MPVRRTASDLEFATEYEAALHQGPPTGTKVLLALIVLMASAGLAWAAWAELDEVTRGDGRVIPSGRNQVVQSLEGGIVKDILVRPGDRVRRGDLLIRIDDTGFAANLGELTAKQANLEAQIVRLKHELSGDGSSPLEFPLRLVERAPQTAAAEMELYLLRRKALDNQFTILKERVEQRQRELAELTATRERFEATLALAVEEEALKAPLAERGVVPKTDVIRLKREITDIKGQLAAAGEKKPRLEAAIREATAQLEEQSLKFSELAQVEFGQRMAELAIVEETIRGARDRVVRTEIKAPVDGIVNVLNVNTIGGVVQAGQVLVEIVPIDDALRVEARVRPSDIAFVHPTQPALVKISAYDFSTYGGLDGEVEKISADSSIDQTTREVYYLVTIKTRTNQLSAADKSLPIFPGMLATVDILTGKKTVLDYLLKPINKARYEALRER